MQEAITKGVAFLKQRAIASGNWDLTDPDKVFNLECYCRPRLVELVYAHVVT